MCTSAFEAVDDQLVPVPIRELTPVRVAEGTVLLDGWNMAVAIAGLSERVWFLLDSGLSVVEIADRLVVGGENGQALTPAVLDVVRQFAAAGLLENVSAVSPDPAIQVTAVREPEAGDLVADLNLIDLGGVSCSSLASPGNSALVVNWNPNCGYCASIATELAGLEEALTGAGVRLVFLASGEAEANRELVDRAGITSPVLLLGDADSPFGSSGTPSAYFLDADRRILDTAYGNIEVPALAHTLAGTEDHRTQSGGGRVPKYLLERDGLCAPGTGSADGPTWVQTVAYRIGDHHVGIRVDSTATADVLDRLFQRRRVDDPRAGHSYSIALASLDIEDGPGRTAKGLNLLIQPGRATVRTRDPGRILRALLADLHDRIHDSAGSENRRRVNAVAVGITGAGPKRAAGLIPRSFHAFAPRLQSLLAERGIALCDTPHPEIDLATREMVIPDPDVDHDPSVISAVSLDPAELNHELPPLLPGRYPFHGWCVDHPGDPDLVEFSPAESAAATISFLTDATDPVVAVKEMGELFRPVAAYGIWCHSDAQAADLVARALKD